jgi:dipeptidyl aminopeptidase/acylaminoacyl peptidase
MLSRLLTLVILVLLINLPQGFSQKSPITLTDLNNLTSISNPQLSDDDKAGLFTLTRIDLENNRRQTTLFWIDIQSAEQHSLGEHKGLSQPRWAGDKTISYIASSDSGRQVFTLSIAGGEPQQITKAKNGVQRYAWSPDGKSIAFITSDPLPEPDNKYNNAVVLGNNDYLMDKPPTPKSIWLFDIATNEAKQLSPAGTTVGTGLSTSGMVWSADSKKLAFVIYPSAYSGDSDLGRMYIADIASDKVALVTVNTGMEAPMAFSNDNKKLYFSYKRDGIAANISDVHLVDLASGKVENITRGLDRTIYGMEILADEKLVFMGIDAFNFKIWKRNREGQFKAIDLGNLVNLGSWSMNNNGAILFTAQSKYQPNQLYFKANLSSPSQQLTKLNEFLSHKALGNQEVLSWPSSDGLTANGVLTYPPGFDENKKYPLILYIHGGPTASSRLGFNGSAQLMAAQGWIVFQPNYRGSNNLGNKFQAAIANDPSEGPGQDVMAGVKVLQEKAFIDKEKIAVSGWSYGGWMTSWLIGRYPETWVAAVAGAAPVDFTDMYSLNDLNRMRRHSITDSPYKGDNLQWAYNNSPIINFSKIKAPTLIMSKTGDYRVTITGSYKLYGALRDNNIPVEFIGYPGPGHFPSDPVRSNDVWQRWIGWLGKYVDGIREETLPTK